MLLGHQHGWLLRRQRIIESLLGVSLTLRGARVRFLLCDKLLPACLQTRVMPQDPGVLARYELKNVLCDGCYAPAQRSTPASD